MSQKNILSSIFIKYLNILLNKNLGQPNPSLFYSEINASINYRLKSKSLLDDTTIGNRIVTKAIKRNDFNDITHQYKNGPISSFNQPCSTRSNIIAVSSTMAQIDVNDDFTIQIVIAPESHFSAILTRVVNVVIAIGKLSYYWKLNGFDQSLIGGQRITGR